MRRPGGALVVVVLCALTSACAGTDQVEGALTGSDTVTATSPSTAPSSPSGPSPEDSSAGSSSAIPSPTSPSDRMPTTTAPNGDDPPPATATTEPSGAVTSPTTQSSATVTTPAATRLPTEDTGQPLPQTPVEPQQRSIEVAGPTIDNRYPAAPLTFEAPGVICNPYTNGFGDGDQDVAGVPVTIRAVEIVDQVPAGPAVFTVTEVADPTSCPAREDDKLVFVGNCLEATLSTYSLESGSACALGIKFSGKEDHVAGLRFQLEATCTDAEVPPCDRGGVPALAPTPQSPVTIQWVATSFASIEACLNSPVTDSGGDCPSPDDDA